jgi:hypothetical protein
MQHMLICMKANMGEAFNHAITVDFRVERV